jgi:hypothetical protein
MNWYVTFGQQYSRETHPHASWVHPDGWMRIVADNSGEARRMAFSILDREWSNLLSEDEFDSSFYPLGELARAENGIVVVRTVSLRDLNRKKFN